MYRGRLSVIRATPYESAKWNSYIPVYNESENSKRSIDKHVLDGIYGYIYIPGNGYRLRLVSAL